MDLRLKIDNRKIGQLCEAEKISRVAKLTCLWSYKEYDQLEKKTRKI